MLECSEEIRFWNTKLIGNVTRSIVVFWQVAEQFHGVYSGDYIVGDLCREV